MADGTSQQQERARLPGDRPWRIAVTGATGLVGGALTERLEAEGHEVVRIGRRADGSSGRHVRWDPSTGELDGSSLEGLDGVVHLAGESIMGRWSDDKKRRIRDSREQGTRLVAETLAGLDDPPGVLVSASAVGYYGDRGDEELDESSSPGEGFLADVCRAWEEAAEPARRAGIRVAHPRIGLVLSERGGALPQMLTPFKLGLGGPIGDGSQWMSWIALDDVVEALIRLLGDEALTGAVHATAPEPVTNRTFTKTLARVLGRPAFFKVPGFAVRTAMGEMGRQLLLSGQRAQPAKLEAQGHAFLHPELEGALRRLLGREGEG